MTTNNSINNWNNPPRGVIYCAASTGTTSVSATTWTLVNNTTTSYNLNQFTMPASNQLRYTGNSTIMGLINCSVISSVDALVGALIGFSVYKNGSQIMPSAMYAQAILDTKIAISLVTMTSLSTNDSISIYCYSSVAGTIAVTEMTVSITTT